MLQELLQENHKGLTEVDYKVLDARCEGISLFEYSAENLNEQFDEVILRIAAISGAKVPADTFFIEMLKQELIAFLMKFGYSSLTIAEILLAFQINSKINIKYPIGIDVTHVGITGDCINVDYISQVLYPYMTIRNLLDRKLENSINGY